MVLSIVLSIVLSKLSIVLGIVLGILFIELVNFCRDVGAITPRPLASGLVTAMTCFSSSTSHKSSSQYE